MLPNLFGWSRAENVRGILVYFELQGPAHVAQRSKHSAPCAVERDAFGGRGSNLSLGAITY